LGLDQFWENLLDGEAADVPWSRVAALLATIQSADIVLPTTDGREIRLRRVAALTAEQQKLLTELSISLPDHFNLNFECSVDSAIA